VPAPRRLLWIGPAQHFPSQIAERAPDLDVVWEPDAERASRLDFADFEAAVVDLRIATRAGAVERLRAQRGSLPLLLWLPPGDGDALPALPGRREISLAGEAWAARAREPGASAFPEVIGRCPCFLETLARLERAAGSEVSVLLCGETGTGKEVLAQALHRRSRRAERPFVAINCAALSETLLESELFGHLRGSFTGAERDRRGLLEQAHTGTLFLDEVSETSAAFQAKLLRVLQERELRPIGALRARPVDLRVVSASHRDLRAEIAAGRFREDLYYRLAVFPLRVPPLRERSADIPALARHFARRHARGSEAPVFAAAAEQLLLAHAWPGNVRELENEVQHALALADPGAAIEPEHFSPALLGASGSPAPAADAPAPRAAGAAGPGLRAMLDRLEAELISKALSDRGGRRALTARELGLTREGLYKKMRRLGIE